MSQDAAYFALNELLINVGRSLLQYVGECWPWTDVNTADERATIEQLVQRQKRQIGPLADLLDQAGWTIDFGTYPTEYTDLHYVALHYLLEQLIENQQGLIEDAKRTAVVCEGHPAAKEMVAEILDVQQSIQNELKTLANSGSPA